MHLFPHNDIDGLDQTQCENDRPKTAEIQQEKTIRTSNHPCAIDRNRRHSDGRQRRGSGLPQLTGNSKKALERSLPDGSQLRKRASH